MNTAIKHELVKNLAPLTDKELRGMVEDGSLSQEEYEVVRDAREGTKLRPDWPR